MAFILELLWILPFFFLPVLTQPPPFLLQTTPVHQNPFYYPQLLTVFNCTGTNEGTALYQPWYSHYISPTMLPTDYSLFQNISVNYANPSLYPIPQTPIECTSSSQLRNGSCTSYFNCVYVMGGTINESPQCSKPLQCCMLPTCALIIGVKTRYGHCRPAKSCPGIFDNVLGVSVGCPDPVNSPCCVAEEVNITCPRNFLNYANALVKSYGLLNVTWSNLTVAAPQRMLAWAPFLLSVFDDTIGMCVNDCHKTSFLQYLMDILSETFMFKSGSGGLYKRLLDWKGISMGLLPSSYFSYYSPYVFSQVIRNIFQNYNLVQRFGKRSFLSAARIIDFLNQEAMGSQLTSNYTTQLTLLSWRSYKYFTRFSDCAAIYVDGAECSNSQGLCSIPRVPNMMNLSEYWMYCPKHLPLHYGDCSGYPSNIVCCKKPYPPLQYGAHLVKGEFHDVVVAVHQAQYKEDSMIADLVRVLTKASAALYTATKGRAYFRTVTILSQWNGTDGNATYETYRNADIKIVPEFSNQARALNLGSCGEAGLGVYISQNHLRQWGAGQTVAKLFAMNRWGFGDEVPSTLSEVFYVPDGYNQGAISLRVGTGCSVNMNVNYQPTYGSQQGFNLSVIMPNPNSVASFAFRPDIFQNENAEFCATTTIPHCDDTRRHNPEPNTPHNRICNRTSTLTTILHTSDFDQTQNSPRFVGNTVPRFKFVQYPNVTNLVIAIVADFSGSVPPTNSSMMLNAIISFLQVAPDEVDIILVSIGPDKKVVVQPSPIKPLSPYVQPTGGLHAGRQQLIETVKGWMYLLRPVLSVKNTSVLNGIESLVSTYMSRKRYRLKILCFSDFFGVAPSDNSLMVRIQEAGYSFWPVSLWPSEKFFRTTLYNAVQYPLYHYVKLLANSTYGRWQFIANTTSMLHWYYAIGTFLDDLNLGTPIVIDNYVVPIGGSVSVPFKVPVGYGLNTSVVIDYNALLFPVSISGSGFPAQNCTPDDRGFQKTFRVACRLGDLSNKSQTLQLSFGQDSKTYFSPTDARLNDSVNIKYVTVMIISRAIEYGSAYTGAEGVPDPWIDPWSNRAAQVPDNYPKAETRLPKTSRIVFEKSEKFRFPKVYAILYQGSNALLGCQLEYDLYLTNYGFSSSSSTDPPGPLLRQVTTAAKMYDDGLGDDGFANDGVYTALLVNATTNGTYSVHVRLKATSGNNCMMKPPGVALVGYANDNSTVSITNGTSVAMSFYKSAGSFDVYVPRGTENIFPLGLIQVQTCGIRDIILDPNANFGTNDLYRLATNFTIYCNVTPLILPARYRHINRTVTYNLAIAEQADMFTLRHRLWSNASAVLQNNATTPSPAVFKTPDGRDAISLTANLSPDEVSPYYFVVVWANDQFENYATRSEINSIVVPTFLNNITGRVTNLPLFTDITTSFPRPDDAWPTAIIFSCVAGSALAIILIIVVTSCLARRRPSPRLLPRHPRPDFGYIDDNRLSVISSHRSSTSALGFRPSLPQPSYPPPVPSRKSKLMPPPTPIVPQPGAQYLPTVFMNNNEPAIYFPAPNNQLQQQPAYHVRTSSGHYQRQVFQRGHNNTAYSSHGDFGRSNGMHNNIYTTNLALMGTADRQNFANFNRQNRFNSMPPY